MEETWSLDSGVGLNHDNLRSLSLHSSILNHRTENGRRYHSYHEGAYLFPNDNEEQERLGLVHQIIYLLQDCKLLSKPFAGSSTPHRALDIGCGTGEWTVEFADEYPQAQVTGVDLSPIQSAWVPPNCSFYVDDMQCAPWGFSHTFDYVHARSLAGGMSDWELFYREAFATIGAGGRFDIEEHDFFIESDLDDLTQASPITQWMILMEEAGSLAGRPLNVASMHKTWMKAAGFVEVQETVCRIPIGGWMADARLKQMGILMEAQIALAIPAWTTGPLTRFLGMPVSLVEYLVENVLDEILDPCKHFYMTWYFVKGYQRGIENSAS